MSRSIKVSDQVYRELRELQGPRETYSHVIERLLAIVRPIRDAAGFLGPGHDLRGGLGGSGRTPTATH